MAKVLELQLQHQSFQHSGLISFRMGWLDLLAVQGTLKCLFQHHSVKASILRPLAFFTVQLSHPYMTTGKTIALTCIYIYIYIHTYLGFPGGSDGKVSACSAGDVGSIPGSGRSPGERNGNPLRYSCLENPMDRGAFHRVTKSQT